MNKDKKSKLTSLLRSSLLESSFVSIVQYRGMTCKNISDMRLELKDKKCNIKIIKNTLAKLALKNTGLEILSPYLKGPTAIAYSNDVIALSKLLSDTSKKNNFFKIIVGCSNSSLVDKLEIESMAKLGSLDQLRSSFIGVINFNQSNFVRVLVAKGKDQRGF